ncbi:MAG: PASTA domain-containing protein, partial [Myxococcota bacterium]
EGGEARARHARERQTRDREFERAERQARREARQEARRRRRAGEPPEEVPVPAVTERIAAEGEALVPDLTGSTARVALRTLVAASFRPILEGTGFVAAQNPPPGELVAVGSRITVTLEPETYDVPPTTEPEQLAAIPENVAEAGPPTEAP